MAALTILRLRQWRKPMNGKTAYVPKSKVNLSDADIPSAGPSPSITGMRKLFWGYDCDIAKQGAYIFKINRRHGEGEIFQSLYNRHLI
jgi:hypothetical protein